MICTLIALEASNTIELSAIPTKGVSNALQLQTQAQQKAACASAAAAASAPQQQFFVAPAAVAAASVPGWTPAAEVAAAGAAA